MLLPRAAAAAVVARGCNFSSSVSLVARASVTSWSATRLSAATAAPRQTLANIFCLKSSASSICRRDYRLATFKLQSSTTTAPSSDSTAASSCSPSSLCSPPIPPDFPLAAQRGPLIVVRGVSNRSIEWRELSFILQRGLWKHLGRSEHEHARYLQHRAQLAAANQTLSQFIARKFFPKIIAYDAPSEHSTTAASPSHLSSLPSSPSSSFPTNPSLPLEFVWTENEFPYFMDQAIGHHLLWCSRGDVDPALVVQRINQKFPRDQFEFIYFINPIENRSIKEIFHAHVFWRSLAQPAAPASSPSNS